MKGKRWIAGVVLVLASVAPLVASPEPRPDFRAFDAFVRVFYDRRQEAFFTLSDHAVKHPKPGRPHAGLFEGYWHEGELWEVCLDAYELEPSPERRALVRRVFDGYVRHYRPTGWNDDLGWWALGCVRAAHDLHDERYLRRAIQNLDSIWHYHDKELDGGIWQRTNRNAKTMCVNAPFVMASMTLSLELEHASDPNLRALAAEHRSRAEGVYEWIHTHLVHETPKLEVFGGIQRDGSVGHNPCCYDYGTWIGANLALYEVEHLPRYRERAEEAAPVVVTTRRFSEEGGPPLVLQTGNTVNTAGFKGITTRQIAALAHATTDATLREQCLAFLDANARAAWSQRRPDGTIGASWVTPEEGVIEGFGAGTSAAVILHAQLAR